MPWHLASRRRRRSAAIGHQQSAASSHRPSSAVSSQQRHRGASASVGTRCYMRHTRYPIPGFCQLSVPCSVLGGGLVCGAHGAWCARFSVVSHGHLSYLLPV
jgi:hypothetical protein